MGMGLVHDTAIELLQTDEAALLNLAEADLEEVGTFLKSMSSLAE